LNVFTQVLLRYQKFKQQKTMSRKGARHYGDEDNSAAAAFTDDNDRVFDDGAEDGENGQQSLGFLTSFQWIPQGFCNPQAAYANAQALAQNQQNLARRLGLSEAEMQELQNDDNDNDDGARNNNKDDDDDAQEQKPKTKKGFRGPRAQGIDDDSYFITGGTDNILQEIESDNESEIDDTTIRETDLVFVVSRAGEEPSFELTIYDEPKDNIYVHHDAQLVAHPLCIEWMYNTEHKTSLAAIGTMHPYIEIWNLDHADAVDPAAVLGGCKNPGDNYNRATFKRGTGRYSKVAKERGLMRPDSHTDAVTSLKWNSACAPSVLASGSADSVIKVWDLNQLTCLGTVSHPKSGNNDRVQSLDWHLTDPNVLLAGCGDSLDILDCRRPDSSVVNWCSSPPNSDQTENIEKCQYLHIDSNYILCSTSGSGVLAMLDVRKGSKSDPIWALPNLHGGEVTFAVSKHAPLLATAGKVDGISLWDLSQVTTSAPQRLSHRKLKVGQCFSIQFHPNSPDVLGACGSAGLPLVYTITKDVRYGRAMLNGETIEEEPDENRNVVSRRERKQNRKLHNAGRGGRGGGGRGGRRN
jgi:periodic tryptophan protein 1